MLLGWVKGPNKAFVNGKELATLDDLSSVGRISAKYYPQCGNGTITVQTSDYNTWKRQNSVISLDSTIQPILIFTDSYTYSEGDGNDTLQRFAVIYTNESGNNELTYGTSIAIEFDAYGSKYMSARFVYQNHNVYLETFLGDNRAEDGDTYSFSGIGITILYQ